MSKINKLKVLISFTYTFIDIYFVIFGKEAEKGRVGDKRMRRTRIIRR